ncbi:hypothetical protein LCGC14_1658450, partial [marine sediment metagenome]
RGFVMLIGHRFSTPYYKNVLPTDWKIEQPPDVIKRIQTFWTNKNANLNEISQEIELANPESYQKKTLKTVDLFNFMEKL